MADISIPWGDQTLTAPLPADWTVQQVAIPAIPSSGEDWIERLADAIAQPEGMPPLGKLLTARSDGRIVVIVEDLTRHSPLPVILETVFREFHHAGIPDENIEIFFATGMHPPMSPEEVAGKIGSGLAENIAWRCNPWRDRDAYVNLGVVRAGGATIDLLVDSGVKPIGRVAIGTVKGDLHEIGKNLVGIMLEGAGFELIDLGVDVSPDRFVQAAQDGTDVLAMSALLTTTMPAMKATIDALADAGLRDKVKVMVGGAPVTQAYADQIGADGYAPDASSAARKAQELLSA